MERKIAEPTTEERLGYLDRQRDQLQEQYVWERKQLEDKYQKALAQNDVKAARYIEAQLKRDNETPMERVVRLLYLRDREQRRHLRTELTGQWRKEQPKTDRRDDKFEARQLRLWEYLDRRFRQAGRPVPVSQEGLASRFGIKPRALRLALGRLGQFVRVTNGGRGPNLYATTLPDTPKSKGYVLDATGICIGFGLIWPR